MKSIQLNIKTMTGALLVTSVFLVVMGCNHKKVVYTLEGYDMSNPEKIGLGTKLDEISGINWVNDSTMIANNDENGKIYAINLLDKKNFDYRNIKFGEKGDYEDIVKVKDTIYLLIATGGIMKVTGYKDDSTILSTVIATVPGKSNEFESMYYDADANSLVMLCKTCHKEKDKVRTAFRYDLTTNTLIDTPYYTIDIQSIRTIMDDNRQEFKPSAMAIHPIQQKIYMISSIGKVLVVADKKGKVEQAIPVSPIMFPQPEGMTFAPNGDLYISNEIGTEERATILKFPFNAKKQ